jgi:hypothetical protein
VPPHLLDYHTTCARFSWEAIRGELDGLPGGTGLNIAHEVIDRHANGTRREHLALRWVGKDGMVRRTVHHLANSARRHGALALHQRYHRYAEEGGIT